jgi:hypothetical protein
MWTNIEHILPLAVLGIGDAFFLRRQMRPREYLFYQLLSV